MAYVDLVAMIRVSSAHLDPCFRRCLFRIIFLTLNVFIHKNTHVLSKICKMEKKCKHDSPVVPPTSQHQPLFPCGSSLPHPLVFRVYLWKLDFYLLLSIIADFHTSITDQMYSFVSALFQTPPRMRVKVQTC